MMPTFLRRGALCAALLLVALPQVSWGQLRPLPPLEWGLFDSDRVATARIGAGVLLDQRASLAGTEGRLIELGEFSVGVRSGRMAMEISGTILRLFDDRTVFAEPYGGAREPAGTRRRDAGDFRVATIVMLTPIESDASVALRFGTRLPTTDNEIGLERDRTDFFALLAGRLQRGGFWLGGEAGVGINGTHDPDLEQSDVLMYSVTAAHESDWFSPQVSLVGHMDGMTGWALRGNEELAEVRVGARVGREVWAQLEAVHGLVPFSPRLGALMYVGIAR